MGDPRRPPEPSDPWNAGWESHRVEQLVMGLAATPAQRLAWLEEMIALAYLTGALPKEAAAGR